MPPLLMTVYSFKDLSGTVTDGQGNTFTFAGQVGAGQISIEMATERTAHDVASDGAIMISAIDGNNGAVNIEMQQTSAAYKFFLSWYNSLITAMQNGDVSNWAAMAMTLRNVTDGTSHKIIGISPPKKPTKVYTAQGQKLVWRLMAGDVMSLTA